MSHPVSLYSRLFAYRQRKDRSPLENFLTEALCDLLNRLPATEGPEFVADLLLPSDDARERWNRRFRDTAHHYFWETQKWITANDQTLCLDLVLFCDRRPLLVVENKVGAAVGQHHASSDDDTGDNRGGLPHRAVENQLQLYGRWLAGQCESLSWPGAIILLTHSTAPPDDFGSGASQYGVRWQRVCRWPSIWNWATSRASREAGDGPKPAWQVLAGDLAEFLRERGMTLETPTDRDLAAAEVYIGSADRYKRLFDRMWLEAVRPVWPDYYGHPANEGRVDYSSDLGVLQDWIYVQRPYSPYNWNVWYVGWGIAFPGTSNWWTDAEPPLPARNYAFVCLWSDNDRQQPLPPMSPYTLWVLGGGWAVAARGGHCVIKACAMCEFDPDPNRLAAELIQWVRGAIEQLRRVAPDIARDATGP
jgi:hypothetical protein